MRRTVYPFKEVSHKAIANVPLQQAITNATVTQDDKRRARAGDYKDLNALRDLAGRIKQHTLEHLDRYLTQFIDNATQAGTTVHYAATDEEAREIVRGIIRANGAKHVVKAKSMASEEIHLNQAIAEVAEVVETDLGEFIVQIDEDRPSHIVTPVIHKTAGDIGRSFERVLGLSYTEDPETLTAAARAHLREKFRAADVGISGTNFAIAETGTICICTNEGNGRMCTSAPRIHIAVMGIEKVIPRRQDLGVFLKLLARHATGQTLTVYTSMITGPRRPGELDGPEQLHIVLLDRGRSENLAGEYRKSLRCIRCGACLNICPVYRNVGGHSYGGVYCGPIGAVLTPLYDGFDTYRTLPHATSLCGACTDVCPVKVPLANLMIHMRREQIRRGITPLGERFVFWAWTQAMRSAWVYALGQKCASWVTRWVLGRGGWIRWLPGLPGGWTRKRPMPVMAKKSFRSRWKKWNDANA